MSQRYTPKRSHVLRGAFHYHGRKLGDLEVYRVMHGQAPTILSRVHIPTPSFAHTLTVT